MIGELESYQKGLILNKDARDYFEELLESSKKELRNEYINSLDSQSSILLNGMRRNVLRKTDLVIELLMKEVNYLIFVLSKDKLKSL